MRCMFYKVSKSHDVIDGTSCFFGLKEDGNKLRCCQALLSSVVVKMARDHTNDWRWLACTAGNIETFCHRVAVLLWSHDTLNHICITDGINLRDRNRAFAPCALWGPMCPPPRPRAATTSGLGCAGAMASAVGACATRSMAHQAPQNLYR